MPAAFSCPTPKATRTSLCTGRMPSTTSSRLWPTSRPLSSSSATSTHPLWSRAAASRALRSRQLPVCPWRRSICRQRRPRWWRWCRDRRLWLSAMLAAAKRTVQTAPITSRVGVFVSDLLLVTLHFFIMFYEFSFQTLIKENMHICITFSSDYYKFIFTFTNI